MLVLVVACSISHFGTRLSNQITPGVVWLHWLGLGLVWLLVRDKVSVSSIQKFIQWNNAVQKPSRAHISVGTDNFLYRAVAD